MRFSSAAQRKAMFANISMPYAGGYRGRIEEIAAQELTTDDPLWLRFLPEKNRLSEFVPDYPGKQLEDLSFRPAAEFGWYRPFHEIIMEDLDNDGIPLIHDMNPFGNLKQGTDYPIGATMTPNVERLMASERGLYDE